MKKILMITMFISLAYQAQAQFQFGAHASRLNNAEQGKWGGGLFVKGLIGDRFAIGANAKVYPQNFQTGTERIGGTDYQVSRGNVIVPLLATFDYRFGENVRPYIGVDAGMYSTRTVTKLSKDNTRTVDLTNNNWYFGAAPKVGLELEVGPVGIFGQVQYNALFGSGDEKNIPVPGINSSINTKPVSKFWNFDVGIYVKLARGDK